VLDVDGLSPGVENDGVERRLGEAALGSLAPDHPWGVLVCGSSRLMSKLDASVNGFGTGLFVADIAGLGVAESRVGWRRGGGWSKDIDASEEERLCLCL
jgi:hypothetical protein